MSQLYIDTDPFFFRFFSHRDYRRILGRVLCAVQQVPVGSNFIRMISSCFSFFAPEGTDLGGRWFSSCEKRRSKREGKGLRLTPVAAPPAITRWTLLFQNKKKDQCDLESKPRFFGS